MVWVGGLHWHDTRVCSIVYGLVSSICGVISPRVVPTWMIVSINISCFDVLLGLFHDPRSKKASD